MSRQTPVLETPRHSRLRRMTVGLIAALCLGALAGALAPRAEAVGDYQYQLGNVACAGGQSNFNQGYGIVRWNTTVSAGSHCYMSWGNTGSNASVFKLHLNHSRDYSGTGQRLIRVAWNDFGAYNDYGDGPFVTYQEPPVGGGYNAQLQVIQSANHTYSGPTTNSLATGGQGVYAHVSDNEGPNLSGISVGCPSGGQNGWCRGTSATASFTSSDNYLGRQPTYLYVDGGGPHGSWDQSLTSHSVTVTAGDGGHTFQARRGGDGWGTAAVDQAFYIDGTAPAAPSNFTLTPAIGGGTQSVSASWGVSDATSGAANGTVEVNSATDGTGSGSWSSVCTSSGSGNGSRSCSFATASLAEGTHLVRVSYSDVAGNPSTYANTTLVIDQTAPTVPSVAGGSSSWVAGPVTLTASGSTDAGGAGLAGYRYRASNDGGLNWVIGGSEGADGSSLELADGGDWIVQFRARDAVGNLSAWSASAQARVDRLPPSAPVVSGGSLSWLNQPSITFTASGSADGQSGPVTYQSRISTDGGASWSAPADGSSRTVTDTGETLVQFRAVDGLGTASTWVWAGPDAVRADNPLAYYRFDEVSGTGLTDYSGNGRSGRYVGGPTLGLAGRPASGDANTAVKVSGATSYGTVPPPPITNSFSFAFWLKLDAITGSYQTVLARGACCGEPYAFYVGPSGELHGAIHNGSSRQTFLTGANTLSAGTWNHIVWTYDGSSQKVYLNGNTNPLISQDASGTVASVTDQLLIGRRAGDITPLAGTIDELAVYGQALAPARIQAHYNAGPSFAAGTARLDRAAPVASLSGGSSSWRNDSLVTLAGSAADDAGPTGLSFQHRVSRDNGATWLSPVTGSEPVVPSPAGVPGLALWLRADQIGASQGEAVSSWSDSSSSAQGASQSAADYRPTYQQSAIGGKPALRFDGSNDFLHNSGLSLGSQVSVFAVAKPASASAGAHRRIINNEANLFLGSFDNGFASFYGNGTDWGTIANHGAQAALTPGSAYVLSSVNNGIDTAFVNGLQVSSRANSMSAFSDGYQVGCLSFGAAACYGPSPQAWNGDIAEIVIVNRAVTTAERQEIERYLLAKYGLDVPASHRSAGEGTTLVQVRATDRSGQTSAWAPAHAGAPSSPDASGTVRIDRTPPSAPTVTGGSTSWQNVASATITASASTDAAGSGLAGYQFQTSTDRGASWSATQSGASYTQTAEGETLARFRAIDGAGNTSAWMDSSASQALADSPAVLYRFGESSGTSVADSSGRGATGTLGGSGHSLGQPSPLAFEATDRSVGLNGSGHVVTPNLVSATAFPSTATTVEVWFKANAPGVVVAELGAATPNAGWHDSQIEVLAGGVVKGRFWSLPDITLGTVAFGSWNHAVIRFDPATNTASGFLNGVKTTGSVGTARSAPYQNGFGLHYALGAADSTHLGSGAALNGAVDEFAVYPAALSDARIQAHYNAGVAPGGLVRIERNDPSPPLVTGGSLSWQSVPSVTFTASGSSAGSGIANYQYRTSTDGGATWSGATELAGGVATHAVSAEGQTLIQFRAKSGTGRLSPWSPTHAGAPSSPDAAATARIDRTAPSAPSVTGGSLTWVVGSVNFTPSGATDAGGSGMDGHEIRIWGPADSSWGAPIHFTSGSYSVIVEGRSRVQIRSRDGAGNTSAWSPSYAATVLADAPRAYWRLDEASGNALDASGNGNTLTYGAGVTRGASSLLSSDPDAAASFDGTGSGQATTSTTISGLGASSATLEAWVTIPSLPNRGAFLKVGGSHGWGLGIGDANFDSNGTQLLGLYESIAWIGTGYSFPAPGTYHVVMTINGSTALFYVNGSLVATRTGLPIPGAPTGQAGIGGYSGTRNFTGTVDEAAVYASPLSAARISAHYSVGTTTANIASVDNAPPSAPSVSGGSSSWQNVASVTVSASGSTDTGSGFADYQYRTSSDGGTSWSAPAVGSAIALSAEGETLVQFRSRDVMGNTSAWTPAHAEAPASPDAAGTVRIDRSSPAAPQVSGGSLTWTNQPVSFTATGSDPGGILRYEHRTSTDAGASWSPVQTGAQLTLSGEGTHWAQFRIVDRAGKTSPWTWATPDQVRQLQPVLYYRLGEAAGPSAIDHSGAGNDGAYHGAFGTPAPGAPVVPDGDAAHAFDGTTSYLTAPSLGLFSSGSFSISAWIKPSALAGTQTILNARASDQANKSLSLSVLPSGAVRLDFFNSALDTPAGRISAGSWHHVVATFNSGSGARAIYIDGAPAASDTSSGYSGATPTINIGRYSSGTNYFGGLIDELAVHQAALTPAQASALHAAGPAFAPGTARIDLTAPAIPELPPGSGSWSSDASVTKAVAPVDDPTGSGYARTEHQTSTDGGVTWSAVATGTEVTVTEPGVTAIRWRAVDGAGNLSPWTSPYLVGIDRTPAGAPTVSGGSDDWQNTPGITLTASADPDGAPIDYYRSRVSDDGGQSWGDIQTGQSRLISAEGDWRAQFQVVDAAGNASEWAPTQPVAGSRARIDRSAPSAAQVSASPAPEPNGFHFVETITVSAGGASDALSGLASYQYRISQDQGDSWSSPAPGASVDVAFEGEAWVEFRALDNVGIPSSSWTRQVVRRDFITPGLEPLAFAPVAGSEDHLFKQSGANTLWFNADQAGAIQISAGNGTDGGYPGGVTTNWPTAADFTVSDQAFNRATYNWSVGAGPIALAQLVATDAAGRTGTTDGFSLIPDRKAPELTLTTPGGRANGVDTFISDPGTDGVRVSWTARDEGAGLRGADSGLALPARDNRILLERRSLAPDADGVCQPAGLWEGAAWDEVALGSEGVVPDARTQVMQGAATDTGVALSGAQPMCFQWRLRASDAVGHTTEVLSGRVLVAPANPRTLLPPLASDGSSSSGSIGVLPGGEIHLADGDTLLNNFANLEEIARLTGRRFSQDNSQYCTDSENDLYYCPGGTIDLLGQDGPSPAHPRASLYLNGSSQPLSTSDTTDATATLAAANVFVRALRGFGGVPAPSLLAPNLESAIDEPADPWIAGAKVVPAADLTSGTHTGDFLVEGDLEIPPHRHVTIKGSLIVTGDLTVSRRATLRILKPSAAQWRRPGLVVASPPATLPADDTQAAMTVAGYLAVEGLLWAEQASVAGAYSTLNVNGAALFGVLDGTPQPGEQSLVQTGAMVLEWTRKVLELRGIGGASGTGLGGVRVQGVVSVSPGP